MKVGRKEKATREPTLEEKYIFSAKGLCVIHNSYITAASSAKLICEYSKHFELQIGSKNFTERDGCPLTMPFFWPGTLYC